MKHDNRSSLPVLIIGYSRIENIRKSIIKLRKYGIREIYVALDFSDNSEIFTKQRQLVNEISRMNLGVHVWHRQKNHGVGVGVITAIDWFFSKVESGVILEDDLDFEKDFLEYSSRALEFYLTSREVLLISGSRFNPISKDVHASASTYPLIWGWATWRLKWDEIRTLIIRKKSRKVGHLLKKNISFFYAGAIRAQRGLVDTWDTPLAYEMLIGSRLCIVPPVNLVSNIGADEHASHTVTSEFPLNFPIELPSKIIFPRWDKMMTDVRANNQFLEFRVYNIRLRHLLSPMKSRIALLYYRLFRDNPQSLVSRLEMAEKFD